jgi:hypothetical protein
VCLREGNTEERCADNAESAELGRPVGANAKAHAAKTVCGIVAAAAETQTEESS